MADKVQLAVSGLGLVGARHVAAAGALADVDLVAAVDPSDLAKEAAARMAIPAFDGLEDLFAAHRLDGLIIATPTPLHVAQARAAVDRGCPVLIEKPIATSAQEAAKFVQYADARGVPVLIGHHRRHNPLIQAAKSALDAGRIGDIRSVQAVCWFYKPDDYFEAAPWRKAPGAGPISVNLIHDIDLLRYLCGQICSVVADRVPSRRGFDNEELATALLTFENGALGTVSVSDSIVSPWSWEMTSKEYPIYPMTGQSCYTLGGSQGALSIPDLTLWQHADQPDWWRPMRRDVLEFRPADPLVEQLAHFRDVIRGQCAPRVSGREGLKSLQVIEAIAKAAETGTRQVLPRDPSP